MFYELASFAVLVGIHASSQWLPKLGKETILDNCTRQLYIYAASVGSSSILDWLFKHQIIPIHIVISLASFSGKNPVMILKWFRKARSSMTKLRFQRTAIKSCALLLGRRWADVWVLCDGVRGAVWKHWSDGVDAHANVCTGDKWTQALSANKPPLKRGKVGSVFLMRKNTKGV